MANLVSILPDFDVAPYSHILPSLERALVGTADLLTLDALDVARRAQVPPGEVQRLADAVLTALHTTAAVERPHSGADAESGIDVAARRMPVSTLDTALDDALGGGVAAGHLTEIVGESAAGKTQFLLTLLLSAQLVDPDVSPRRSALYISTEAPLQTARLSQILDTNPQLASLPPVQRPSLNRIHYIRAHDVEAQEHILRFQVPVAIRKHNVSLVAIDSIAANYRAEFDRGGPARKSVEAIARRSNQLAQTASLLRHLARTQHVAVVVANQVADRFSAIEPAMQAPTQSTPAARPASPLHATGVPPIAPAGSSTSVLSTHDPLAVDHQQRFYTGWGDDASVTNLKTPSLGLTWTNQLATRIALLKEPIYEEKAYAPGDERDISGWKRACKVVFSASAAESKTDFEIWQGGIRTVTHEPSAEPHI